jgi:hypothetical protein
VWKIEVSYRSTGSAYTSYPLRKKDEKSYDYIYREGPFYTFDKATPITSKEEGYEITLGESIILTEGDCIFCWPYRYTGKAKFSSLGSGSVYKKEEKLENGSLDPVTWFAGDHVYYNKYGQVFTADILLTSIPLENKPSNTNISKNQLIKWFFQK